MSLKINTLNIHIHAANDALHNAPEKLMEDSNHLEWSKTLCEGESVTYEEAEKACKELGDGWRLPTRHELESLIDLTRHDPAIDTTRFPDTKSRWYWTSTETAWNPSAVWFVSFNYGLVDSYHRNYYACVRAVRASQ